MSRSPRSMGETSARSSRLPSAPRVSPNNWSPSVVSKFCTPRPLDLNGLITDMTGMLRMLIGENIAVTLSLAPDLPRALADRRQLEQVVMNLVVNARDAMPDGGRVTIETADVELGAFSLHKQEIIPGHYLMLAITDTGKGMTKETQ